jgi:hypothetical protein
MLHSPNKYIRFAANALLFAVVVFVLDQVSGRMLRHYYFKVSSGEIERTTYTIDSTKADILIMGSSRALHHYIPGMIEDSMGKTCYNAGRDGAFIYHTYAVFQAIVNRYSPKIIMLDIYFFRLHLGQNTYEGLAPLLPYYDKHTELQQFIRQSGTAESLKLLSYIYPFNSKVLSVISGNLQSDKSDANKGYIPLNGVAPTALKPEYKPKASSALDPAKIMVIENMAKICHEKGIRLVVVQSPSFEIRDDSDDIRVITQILKKYDAEFLSFSDVAPFNSDATLFHDRVHLNNRGAELFTGRLINKLKAE